MGGLGAEGGGSHLTPPSSLLLAAARLPLRAGRWHAPPPTRPMRPEAPQGTGGGCAGRVQAPCKMLGRPSPPSAKRVVHTRLELVDPPAACRRARAAGGKEGVMCGAARGPGRPASAHPQPIFRGARRVFRGRQREPRPRWCVQPGDGAALSSPECCPHSGSVTAVPIQFGARWRGCHVTQRGRKTWLVNALWAPSESAPRPSQMFDNNGPLAQLVRALV